MKKAFLNLVETLWRFGHAGQIASIVILLSDEKQTMASVVGAIETKRSDIQELLKFDMNRKNEMASSLPFSEEVDEAINILVHELEASLDSRYTLLVMHPSTLVRDIVVVDGMYRMVEEDTPGASAWAYGTIAQSSYKMPEGIEYIVPQLHRPRSVVREEEPLPA